MPMHDLTGRVALITGVGSIGEGWGNGKAIATLLARQGAIIFGCDISLEAAESTASLIRSESNKKDSVTVVQTDVTKSASVKELVDACMRKHTRIDILVNNVGGSEPGGPAEMTEEVWDRQTDLNLKSVYLTTHLVLPIMERQDSGGAVVNLASVAGLRHIGKPQVAYAATKAAVIQFTKATSVLYAAKRVRLNTVVPGLMNTPLVRTIAQKYGGDYDAVCKKRDGQVPMGKMGDAWDVAHAALFLLSDEARYVTGQEIVLDGALINQTG
ncbi:MAG: hypothetical protein M1833_005189 [Piccolia ochrophora]|nr:MAG: hypothetical protein M1833_005189 [Piccolia ochrophora]